MSGGRSRKQCWVDCLLFLNPLVRRGFNPHSAAHRRRRVSKSYLCFATHEPCPVCMAADRRPPPCWVTSINQEVIQQVSRNNLRIGEITISPILTCLSLSDWQRKTLIIVIIQQWYSLESIFCDVESASQLAGATKSSTSGFVFRSEFANPWHPKFNKVNFYIKRMSGNKNMYFIFWKKKVKHAKRSF